MTRLLVVKTSSMGDVVHTMPAITEALAARPDLEIDWLVEAPFAPLVALHPGIARIHHVETRRWRRAPLSRETWQALTALRRGLRDRRYDLVIDAQGLLKSAVPARLAGAPVHGLDAASAREGLAARLYAKSYAVPRDLHAIDRTRSLFGQVLGYRPQGAGNVFGIAAGQAADPRSAFLIHGTSWDSKKWPLDHWIALARGLSDLGFRLSTTWGSEAERQTAEALSRAVPEVTVVPRSGLGDIAAIIGRAGLVVGVDTGLTHLAAALARPTVAIFVASRPGLTGPRGECIAILEGSGAAGLKPVSRRDGMLGEPPSAEALLAAASELIRRG